ncbi:MAG TPA: hypothetical protein VGY53_11570, partial [Isosphaeraceae bacterium]|nr:hypothetical protein [Isosphaeraceae bacterium]
SSLAARKTLPSGGFPSPMGFWLHPLTDSSATQPGSRCITIRSPNAPAPAPETTAKALAKPGDRPPQTVRVKGQTPAEGDLVVTIDPSGALVVGTEAAWQNLAEGVQLAVCQYWRFCEVDAEIDRITELAHAELGHATMVGFSSLRKSRTLIANAHAVRSLMVDLPHFEGPITSALAYCSTTKAAEVYELMAERLELEDWCDLIDERVETIEDTYESVTEKLLELRNFAWEAVLEVLIIVILLAELVFNIFEHFAP